MRFVRALPFLTVIAVLGAGAGLLYASLAGRSSIPVGMIYGASIGLTVSFFERGLMLGGLQDRIRRWPSLIYIPVSEAACLALVCLGYAIGGSISWALGLVSHDLAAMVLPEPGVLAYAFVVSAILIFVTRVRDLLGRTVFTNFLIGRYHRPVKEERIFLFLDLVGSTAYARAQGDLRAQDFLGAIFAALAEPVRLYGGTIDDYVGDLALITWPMGRGLRNADCIRCVFEILDRIEADAAAWRRRFGQVPRFHIALHGGPVVTAEVGVDRHKISYFGDVVNTTSRLERLSRDLGAPVLVSADLIGRLATLPEGVRARSLGVHALTGRDQRLEVFGLDEVEAPNVLKVRPGTGGVRRTLPQA